MKEFASTHNDGYVKKCVAWIEKTNNLRGKNYENDTIIGRKSSMSLINSSNLKNVKNFESNLNVEPVDATIENPTINFNTELMEISAPVFIEIQKTPSEISGSNDKPLLGRG